MGYRCPDCMQQERPVQPTTVAGATAIMKPYVTYTLIVINVIVFAVQYSAGINAVAEEFGMWPVGIAIGGEWYRLITSAFLHGSFLHIAFNMYVLFALGPTLERILGHGRFIILYLAAALGGAVASYYFSDIRTVSTEALACWSRASVGAPTRAVSWSVLRWRRCGCMLPNVSASPFKSSVGVVFYSSSPRRHCV